MLGPDNFTGDRHETPFYTVFAGDKYTTPGVEVHANTLRTLLTGDFLQPVPTGPESSACSSPPDSA